MPNIEDDIRKAGKRLKALRKTASAHNKANRIFVYKRDGQNVSEDALKSQMRSKGLSTESRAAQLRNMVAGGVLRAHSHGCCGAQSCAHGAALRRGTQWRSLILGRHDGLDLVA